MSRQGRTAIEFEQMIIAWVRASTACPRDLRVKVVDGRWDAFPGPIDKEAYPDCLSVIIRIASAPRAEYDLDE
jgi:hypothetical protein